MLDFGDLYVRECAWPCILTGNEHFTPCVRWSREAGKQQNETLTLTEGDFSMPGGMRRQTILSNNSADRQLHKSPLQTCSFQDMSMFLFKVTRLLNMGIRFSFIFSSKFPIASALFCRVSHSHFHTRLCIAESENQKSPHSFPFPCLPLSFIQ